MTSKEIVYVVQFGEAMQYEFDELFVVGVFDSYEDAYNINSMIGGCLKTVTPILDRVNVHYVFGGTPVLYTSRGPTHLNKRKT